MLGEAAGVLGLRGGPARGRLGRGELEDPQDGGAPSVGDVAPHVHPHAVLGTDRLKLGPQPVEVAAAHTRQHVVHRLKGERRRELRHQLAPDGIVDGALNLPSEVVVGVAGRRALAILLDVRHLRHDRPERGASEGGLHGGAPSGGSMGGLHGGRPTRGAP